MGTTILKDGKIIDGRGDVIEKGSVAMRDGVICEVCSSVEAMQDSVYPGATVVDVAGRVLMPGLIDTHLHFYMDGAPDYFTEITRVPMALKAIRAVRYARTLLEAGFTTVRGSGDGNGYMDIALRDAINQGYVPGPRILASGYHLTMTGGHGYFHPPWITAAEDLGMRCDGPDSFRKAAREQLARGADSVKLVATRGLMTPYGDLHHSQLTVEEMEAAVEEAHKQGKIAEAHAEGADGIKNALRAGVDTIAHGAYLDEEGMDMMLERGVALAPTLSGKEVTARRGLEGGIPKFHLERCQRHLEHVREVFPKWLRWGVKIALGGDYGGVPLLRHGENAYEIALMVEYGMSPMQAIEASTRIAAEALHIDHVTGTLEKGKAADILVLRQNPLDDIRTLCGAGNIEQVYKEGRLVVDGKQDGCPSTR